jgi:hypothetical protein
VTCSQARIEGTLDAQVFSLQARRALFKSLDLIPPELMHEAPPGAADTAALDCPSAPACPTQQLSLDSKRLHLPCKHRRGPSRSDKHDKRSKQAQQAISNSTILAGFDADTTSDSGSADDSAPAATHQDSQPPHSAASLTRQEGRAKQSLQAEGAPLASFAGANWLSSSNTYCFSIQVLGRRVALGTYKPQQAKSGARLYDALQLLLHGPCANTTFPWRTYTQPDIAAAVEVLESKGVDVHQAVVHAREGRNAGQWTGVICSSNRKAWSAQLCIYVKGSPQLSAAQLNIRWGVQQSPDAAARQADCGLLALHGLRCTTNFPASAYHQLQLVAAGEHAISKGAEPERVNTNLKAVQQVRESTLLSWRT